MFRFIVFGPFVNPIQLGIPIACKSTVDFFFKIELGLHFQTVLKDFQSDIFKNIRRETFLLL